MDTSTKLQLIIGLLTVLVLGAVPYQAYQQRKQDERAYRFKRFDQRHALYVATRRFIKEFGNSTGKKVAWVLIHEYSEVISRHKWYFGRDIETYCVSIRNKAIDEQTLREDKNPLDKSGRAAKRTELKKWRYAQLDDAFGMDVHFRKYLDLSE